MLKTPISFKGPAGQLERLFDEGSVFSAYKQIEKDTIANWRFNEESKMVYASFVENSDQTFQVNMSWPPVSEPIGNCQCTQDKPCKHLISLVLYNKSKLDKLPPFTQQLRALNHVSETFGNWLNQQRHDPFPRMARHRLIYVLNENQDNFTITLFKAYLTQDDQYQVKADLDSSVISRKSLPKFVSLADQKVLYTMHSLGMKAMHTFVINPDLHKNLLLAVVKTGRCFWKACYRPPLQLEQIKESLNKNSLHLTDGLQFIPAENKIVEVNDEPHSSNQVIINEDTEIAAEIQLKTTWVELDWKPGFIERIDFAEVKFHADGHGFGLDDVSSGLVQLSQSGIEQLAAWCYQIEKLPSIHAKYESPISEQFDINDRYIPNNFITVAPLLLALQRNEWIVNLNQSYRLNSQKAKQIYIQVDDQKSGPQNWFDVEVGVQVDDLSVNLIPYLVKAIKTGQFDSVKEDLLIKLDDGRFIDVPKTKVMQIIDTLNELYDENLLNDDDKVSMNQHQLLRLAEIKQPISDNSTESTVVQWLGSVDMAEKIQQLSQINSLPKVNEPDGLHATLRPYQLTGISWLKFLFQHQLHGILADDMGLGKTLQVLAHLLSLKKENNLNEPVLVVAPTSLLGNWQAECEKFTPELRTVILTGAKRKSQYPKINHFDLVITSYGVMSRDYTQLSKITWHSMILDEAQAIKNRKTQVSQIAKKIQAQHRLCLSGTPMENHLGEIWSLFDFLMPGFLATEKLFQQCYQWPIEKEQNAEKLAELQQRLAPFIMRRTKTEVAKELPAKNEIIKVIELSEQQASVYESIRITMTDEIRKAVKNQQANQILIGNALLRLRQVCCHPSLLKLDSAQTAESAKLDWLSMAVPNLVEEGRRILIFSSFTSMLQIIADKLDELDVSYCKLTGATPPHKRTEQIAAFQAEEAPVFLISLKAGGAGINLTAADTVIHYDPWWNPAAEQQASDRAHRIGQDKQVFIYKLITHGTVEEKIHKLQQQKQQLADNLLAKNNDIAEILSEHHWETMLSPITTKE
jgi:SNF2 family DNA or RNA helicase